MRKIIIFIFVLALAGGGAYWAYRTYCGQCLEPSGLVLYGNVDIRQVNLAFKDTERIKDVLVQEGDAVKKGQNLAGLETQRLTASINALKAGVQAQKYVLAELENGSRPERIQQARAEELRAQTEEKLAELIYKRQARLLKSGANSQQDLDDARSKYEVATARYRVARQNRILVEKGPRWEVVAAANATLNKLEADLDVLKVRLAQSTLYAPKDAIVRSRNLEPGDMASAQRPVFTLGIMDPKWIRAYISEDKLGLVKPGMPGYAVADSWPNKRFTGTVGFISPTAEFTPRSVETPELRTSLVYEIRLNVNDPDNDLRLGMPVTVHLESETGAASNGSAGNDTGSAQGQ